MRTEKTRCTVRNGRFVDPCKGLEAIADSLPATTRRKGIFRIDLVNTSTFRPTRTYYVVKSGQYVRTPALLLFCPACGVRIGSPAERSLEVTT